MLTAIIAHDSRAIRRGTLRIQSECSVVLIKYFFIDCLWLKKKRHVCITAPQGTCWLWQLYYAFVNHDDPDPAGVIFRGIVTSQNIIHRFDYTDAFKILNNF